MLFGLFKTLPIDIASALGGFIARSIGPYLRAHMAATNNLTLMYPKMTFSERHKVLMGMWDNLGRVAAELPHLPGDVLLNRMEILGKENMPKPGDATLFFSGHIGNWELTYPIAPLTGLTATLAYREANNPIVDKMIRDIRSTRAGTLFAKGSNGAIKMIRALKQGDVVALLTDQKMNEGMPIPFFGYDAMTATTIAELALRFDLPIIPIRIVRTGGCHFKGHIYPALQYEKTGDKDTDVRTILTLMNATFESWIREFPEQWFWVHKRWPKEPKKSDVKSA